MELPVIPPEEYPKRWGRLQGAMAERGLDLLIAYADDHATAGPAHVRYLADFPAHFEPVCIAVPATGEPLLLSGPESEEYARLKSQVKDIRVVHEFTHPDEEYPFTTLVSLGGILAELGVRASRPLKRVGLAGLEIMSFRIHRALMAALAGVETVDAENMMTRLRASKSAAERQVIAYAYRIAEAGMRACFEALDVGVTERQIAAEAEYAMRSMGAEGSGIDTIVASGPHTRPILARTSFRQIQEGDLVLFTIAPRYEGYHAAIGRPVFIGEPPGEIRQAMETAVEAQRAAMAAMRPGTRGGDVEGAARRVVESAGLGPFFLYSGVHSVGLVEFEPPIFGPGSDELLQENMVLSIDVPLFHAPWGGLRYEDGYLVTAEGAQPLDNFATGVLTL
jgi:Xaa-Pro aminopeptidase